MIEIENYKLLLDAAKKMDILSHRFCKSTECNSDRMKSVENNDNCEWYHGGWMYCRLANIVVSEDYLGDQYELFFEQHSNAKQINVLICGLADFAILGHLLRRIPYALHDVINIYVVDICNSPLELCKWYIEQKSEFSSFSDKVFMYKADATNLPFQNQTFDLITSYSFLTRMILPVSQNVINEWKRVLKQGGKVLTTIHVADDDVIEGQFYRSSNANQETAIEKFLAFVKTHDFKADEIEYMLQKVTNYTNNIMSSALSRSNIVELFASFETHYFSFDQPGELEVVHKMIIVDATYSDHVTT